MSRDRTLHSRNHYLIETLTNENLRGSLCVLQERYSAASPWIHSTVYPILE
jgi:hypothetical protein